MGFWDWLPGVGDSKPTPAPRQPSDLEREKTPAPKVAPPARGSQNDPANWPRTPSGNVKGKATTTGARMPDQQTLDMLRQGGWVVPEVYTGTAPVPAADKYKMEGTPVTLADFDYTISKDEWERIKAGFEGRTGFTPPSNPLTEEKTAPPVQTNTGYAPSPPTGPVNMATPREEVIPKFNMEETQSQALSYDTYLKLTPDQKAGIDMNALFVNAHEKDMKETNTPTEEQRKVYDADVQRIFGMGRGSEKYAPETVALVKQLGLDIPGMDLDEFIALDYTIDIDDLGKFELKGKDVDELYGVGVKLPEVYQAEYNQVRSEENQRLGLIQAVRQSKAAIDAAFSDLYGVRGDVVSTLATGRKADVASYGGTEQTLPHQAGFPLAYPGGIEPTGLSDDERGKDMFYTSAYGVIADKSKDISELWSLVENSPAANDQAELDALFAYFDQRTRQEAQYGRPKGLAGDSFRSPEEIRKWIGLDNG